MMRYGPTFRLRHSYRQQAADDDAVYARQTALRSARQYGHGPTPYAITYNVAIEDTSLRFVGASSALPTLLVTHRSGWARVGATVNQGDTLDPPANRVVMANPFVDSPPSYFWLHAVFTWGVPIGETTNDCTLIRMTAAGHSSIYAKANGVRDAHNMQIRFDKADGMGGYTTLATSAYALPIAGESPSAIDIRFNYKTLTMVADDIKFFPADPPYNPIIQTRHNQIGNVIDNLIIVTGSAHNDGTYEVQDSWDAFTLALAPGQTLIQESAVGTNVTIDLPQSLTFFVNGTEHGRYVGNMGTPDIDNFEFSNPTSNGVVCHWSEMVSTGQRLIGGGVLTLAPAGTSLQEWNGSLADINSSVINDSLWVSTDTIGLYSEWKVSNSVPSDRYLIGAFFTEVRCMASGAAAAHGAEATGLNLTVKNDGGRNEDFAMISAPYVFSNFQRIWSRTGGGLFNLNDIINGKVASGVKSVVGSLLR